MTDSFPIHEILDSPAAAVVQRVFADLDHLPPAQGQAGYRHLFGGLERLRTLWKAIERYPRLRDSQTLGRRQRNLYTLLERFSNAEPYTIEAYLPTRASLARSYGVAQFNFFRMLTYLVEDTFDTEGEGADLARAVRATGRQTAAALIAEDVLRSIACDQTLEQDLRRHAAEILAAFWDQRATRSLADFAPLLDSAWRAKANVEICYGTLAGVSEILQMSAAGIDSEFIDYFSDEQLHKEQHDAFEEFLFNATYEELTRMREFMKENARDCLEPEEVAHIFGVKIDRLHRTTVTAEDMFFTFREREMWSRLRRMRQVEGPKKTAEEYVMIYVLGRRRRLQTPTEARPE